MPRLRFSLKTLFLALLVTTLTGSNVFTSYRLKQSRDENAKLRTELGYLTIEDHGKLNVVAIATHEELTWRWRVYIPEGLKLVLRAATRKVPEYGLPAESGGRTGLRPGEHLVTAAVRRDREGKWQLKIGTSGSYSRTPIPEAATKWLDDKWSLASTAAGAGGTETKEPGKPLRLLRVVSQAQLIPGVSPVFNLDSLDLPRGKPNRISDGLMLWIDEATEDEIAMFWP